jgi:TIR domain
MKVNKEIFVCYAHEDELLLKKLEQHLSLLRRQGIITTWYDRQINAGTPWEKEIRKHLDSAHIILLLISPDFMDSDYCYGIEMKRAMERHGRGDACVIPVILRPVYWQSAAFGELQVLPTDAKAVTSWSDLDQALSNVAEGILKVIHMHPTALTETSLPRSSTLSEELIPTMADANSTPMNMAHQKSVKPIAKTRRKLFIGCCKDDLKFLQRFLIHLKVYQRSNVFEEDTLEVWDDTRIESESDWKLEIQEALAMSKIAVLLISADFLATDFIREYELPMLLEAAQAGEITLTSVVLSPCAFMRTSLAQYPTINGISQPLASMSAYEQEEVWLQLAESTVDILNDNK